YQAETVKINENIFIKSVENGGLLLSRMERQGKKISEIYTVGYYSFWLCCDDDIFYFDLGNDGTAEIAGTEPRNVPPVSDDEKQCYTNDSYIYGSYNDHIRGLDIWNLSAITTGVVPAMESEWREHPYTSDIDDLPRISEITPMEITVKGMTEDEVFQSDEEYEKVMEEAVRCVSETENYRRTAEKLKKSKGMYLLGGNPWYIDSLYDSGEPEIFFSKAVKGNFDGKGEGYVLSMYYFDLYPEFAPYNTGVCVYIDSGGSGHILIEKGMGIVPVLISADRDYLAVDGGVNNVTGFFEVYDLRNSLQPIASEWRNIGFENNAVKFLSPDIEHIYYGCFDSDTRKFGLYRSEDEP
ncbi:MAG: hypothetical protein NC078_12790, partial [Ruminococcus sp.]|nr:hypothetical protein [Ruminococcus sp.]